MSVAKMHEMYLEAHEPEVYALIKAGEEADPEVKYEYYRNYFNTHFNLSFGLPKTDTCARCDELNIKINDATDETERQRLQAEKHEHLHMAQEFLKCAHALP